MAIDYDNVILSGASAIQAAGYGKLRMIDQGVGFKNRDTNATLTLPAAEVKSAVWFRGVRGPTMRLGITKGDKTDFVDFEALPKDVSFKPPFFQSSASPQLEFSCLPHSPSRNCKRA